MRRLLYCGEWIESHALHVYLLHAPDFLGYRAAIEMAADHPDVVERGLRLKKAGNALMTLVGGRSVHPVNVQGRRLLPAARPRAELAALRPQLERALDDALATVTLVAGFDFPDFEQAYEYVALRADASDYPIEAGLVRHQQRHGASRCATSTTGSPRSTCAHSQRAARPACGTPAPTSWDRSRGTRSTTTGCRPPARQAADAAGLGPTCRNPFRSIVVRAVELVVACEEALRIIDGWSDGGVASVAGPAARGRRVTAPPRRRAACCTTATSWRRTAPSWMPRDRAADVAEPGQHRGRPACVRAATAGARRRASSPASASRRSATTTRASPAPPTSSTSPWSGRERRGRRRQPRRAATTASGPWWPQRVAALGLPGVEVRDRGRAARPGRDPRGPRRRRGRRCARAAGTPGPGRRLEPRRAVAGGPAASRPIGSHGIGVLEAVELARALGGLAARLTVVGVEAGTLETGATLSAQVAEHLDEATRAVAGRGRTPYRRGAERRLQSARRLV